MTNEDKCLSWEAYMERYSKFLNAQHASYIVKQGQNVLRDQPGTRSTWWKWREIARCAMGEHELILPENPLWTWIYNEGFYKYFPVVHRDDRTKISYVPNDDHGLADRRMVTRVGRFLTANFAGRLTPERIAEIGNAYAVTINPPALKLARTQAEIVKIYSVAGGLKTCMAGKSWGANGHPARAYNNEAGSLPVAIAYIEDELGHPYARCVVRTDRTPHHFGRIYGNEYAMRQALHAAGYVGAGDALDGCEVAVVRQPNGGLNTLLMPYFDSPSRHVLVNVSTARAWAVVNNDSANRILKREKLMGLGSGDNVMAETSQYGIIKHDSFCYLGDKSYARQQQIECPCCGLVAPKRSMQRVFTGELVCTMCLRDSYVQAVVNQEGDYGYLAKTDRDLQYIDCAQMYMRRGLDPCRLFNVVWSEYEVNYIRAGDSVESPIMGSLIAKPRACRYRVLHQTMAQSASAARHPASHAMFGWLLQNSKIVFEVSREYPQLVIAVWIDPNDFFNGLRKGSGDESGEKKEQETSWGTRFTRIEHWVSDRLLREVSPGAIARNRDTGGVLERFEDITRCALNTLLASESTARALGMPGLARDVGGATARRA